MQEPARGTQIKAPDAGRAVVFGASGGIGGALVAELAARGWRVAAGSRDGRAIVDAQDAFSFDLADEASIAAGAEAFRADPPRMVLVATGALTLPGGQPPEKSYRQLDADALAEAFRINTIGPALIAKHMLPLFPRAGRSVFAALGARVGSITDNRLGGWYGYRASKAALAMLIRTLAVEVARTHADAVVVGLHPGTVATLLSAPFQRNVAPEDLRSPVEAAARLLTVLDELTPAHSGEVRDWQGELVLP